MVGAFGGTSGTQGAPRPLPHDSRFNPQGQLAPEGYTHDPDSGRLIQYVGSGADTLSESHERQKLRDKLFGLLDRPEQTWGGGGTVNWNGGGGDFTYPTGRPGDGGAPTPAPVSITMPDNSAAQANIFARAKDKVGQETAGSLTSLRSALAGRGMLGGGAEVRGTQNILTAGQGQLGDTTREQAVTEANRQSDFAKTGYEGQITQRGQDVTSRGQDLDAQTAARNLAFQAAKTNYEGQITQRGQNISAQGTRNPSITALLGKLY